MLLQGCWRRDREGDGARGDLCKGEGRVMNMREKRALCEGGLEREGEIRAVK